MADKPYPQIISRRQAKAQGLKTYFTAKLCVNGHIAERRVQNCECLECRTERSYARSERHHDPASRQRAIEAGLTKYISIYPCKYGHTGERYVAGRGCVECNRIRHFNTYRTPEYKAWDAARQIRYRKTEKGKDVVRVNTSNRRALKRDNGGNFSVADLEFLKRTQKKCYLCGKRFTKKNPATIEHIIPLSKGGPHDITNIMLAHDDCNKEKKVQILQLL